MSDAVNEHTVEFTMAFKAPATHSYVYLSCPPVVDATFWVDLYFS